MRFLQLLFEAEGGAGGAPPAPTPKPDPDPKPDPEPEDLSGLKSALEKERAARKAALAQVRELQEIRNRAEADEKRLAEYQSKLAEYEFREKRESVMQAAIEQVAKDGKSSVDADRAMRLASVLRNPETLEADVAEIVAALATIKNSDDPSPDPAPRRNEPLRGQPNGASHTTTDTLPYSKWAELRKTDPEAYVAMIEARRSGNSVRIMGSQP